MQSCFYVPKAVFFVSRVLFCTRAADFHCPYYRHVRTDLNNTTVLHRKMVRRRYKRRDRRWISICRERAKRQQPCGEGGRRARERDKDSHESGPRSHLSPLVITYAGSPIGRTAHVSPKCSSDTRISWDPCCGVSIGSAPSLSRPTTLENAPWQTHTPHCPPQ